MYETLEILTGPTVQGVDLVTSKLQCRVDSTDTTEDALLNLYIGAVTQAVSAYLKKTLTTTQYKLTRDLMPSDPLSGPTASTAYNAFLNTSVYPYTLDGVFKILNPPLVSVDSIRYRDLSGNWQTLDSTYYVYTTGNPGRIGPAYGKIWPFTLPQIGSVEITYTAGASTVPYNVQAAILLWVGSLFRNREAVTEGSMSALPFGVKELLDSASRGFYR